MSKKAKLATESANYIAVFQESGKKVMSKANYLPVPAMPDLLTDIPQAKAAKPEARVRTKSSKGRVS